MHRHVPVLYHVLYLSQTATHRVLLSFPTRRSSDLFNASIHSLIPASPVLISWPPPTRQTITAQSEWRSRQEIKNSGDRKSTRLNSSHRCISYAVFCLKKKKIVTISVTNSSLCIASA